MTGAAACNKTPLAPVVLYACGVALEIVFLLQIVDVDFRDAELAGGARQTVVGLTQRVTQQEAFERALGLLPARQLVAVEDQPVVIREDDLLFVLGRDAIVLVAEPGVFEVIEQFAGAQQLGAA